MELYFAPMEGVTGYVYRNAHRAHFGGVDKYFSPFLSPNQNHRFTSKEENDVLPEHNRGIHLVPQILTNRAEDFIWAAGEMKARGYGEVNLNLGCPSGTVTAKHKGSGFLALPDALDRFLDEVFQAVDMEISVKTRVGSVSPDEFEALLEIFNRYPIKELTVHPRVRLDYYKNTPNLEAFALALERSRCPVCYNGDIFTTQRFHELCGRFSHLRAVMLGRGLVANPALGEMLAYESGRLGEVLEETGAARLAIGAEAAGAPGRAIGPDAAGAPVRALEQGPAVPLVRAVASRPAAPPVLDNARLSAFHRDLYDGYRQVISGEKNVLFKMKEMWFYMMNLFPDAARAGKKIRKVQHFGEYEAAVSELFREYRVDTERGYPPAV